MNDAETLRAVAHLTAALTAVLIAVLVLIGLAITSIRRLGDYQEARERAREAAEKERASADYLTRLLTSAAKNFTGCRPHPKE
ncbi:MAG TPA: hypothetical protein VNH46_08630 [Gemmatimonadales bacterium]|nr:hypothetical protein [Gemmatimonadales bacterium]